MADAPVIDGRGNLDRRSKTAKDLIGLTPTADEMLAEEIDGQLYAYKKEWRCLVCTSDPDVRRLIDSLLVAPKTYRETLELVTPMMEAKQIPEDKRPSYYSIRNHQKRHLPYDKLAVREIVERRAAEAGRSVMEGRGRILTAEAVLELVVSRGWDDLVEKRSKPDVRETVDAAMKLNALEQQALGSVDVAALMQQLQIILQAVRNNVPADMWDRIAAEIGRAKEAMEALPSAG